LTFWRLLAILLLLMISVGTVPRGAGEESQKSEGGDDRRALLIACTKYDHLPKRVRSAQSRKKAVVLRFEC
jgi:hypothetical protein